LAERDSGRPRAKTRWLSAKAFRARGAFGASPFARAFLPAIAAAIVAVGVGDRGDRGLLAVPAAFAGKPARARAARPPRVERVVRVLRGEAIWYGRAAHGKRTASGERFNRHVFTAAHRSLPLGTRVRVIDLKSGRRVIVRINDRGPYGRDRSRIIDVSEAAARKLGFRHRGSTRVKLEVLGTSPPRPAQARDESASARPTASTAGREELR